MNDSFPNEMIKPLEIIGLTADQWNGNSDREQRIALVKKAYKKAALKYHSDRPDRNEEKFKTIAAAFGNDPNFKTEFYEYNWPIEKTARQQAASSTDTFNNSSFTETTMAPQQGEKAYAEPPSKAKQYQYPQQCDTSSYYDPLREDINNNMVRNLKAAAEKEKTERSRLELEEGYLFKQKTYRLDNKYKDYVCLKLNNLTGRLLSANITDDALKDIVLEYAIMLTPEPGEHETEQRHLVTSTEIREVKKYLGTVDYDGHEDYDLVEETVYKTKKITILTDKAQIIQLTNNFKKKLIILFENIPDAIEKLAQFIITDGAQLPPEDKLTIVSFVKASDRLLNKILECINKLTCVTSEAQFDFLVELAQLPSTNKNKTNSQPKCVGQKVQQVLEYLHYKQGYWGRATSYLFSNPVSDPRDASDFIPLSPQMPAQNLQQRS